MAVICYRCGKRALRGNLVAHSNVRTKRTFRPNLHVFWVKENGKHVRAKFCSKCIRIIKKGLTTHRVKKSAVAVA